MNRSICKLTLCFISLITICLFDTGWSQEWSQWRGSNRDGHINTFSTPKAWPDQLRTIWSIPVGAGLSTPVVKNNRIYLIAREESNEVVSCFNFSDGKEIWRYEYNAPFIPNAQAVSRRFFPNSQGKGPFATPLVHGSYLYTLGIDRAVSCFDTKTGKLLWQHQYYKQTVPEKLTYECPPCGCDVDGQEFDQPGKCSSCRMNFGVKGVETSAKLNGPNYYGAAASPIYFDNMIIIHVGNAQEGSMIAFDTNGKEKWIWESPAMSSSSPIVGNIHDENQIVTLTRTSIAGISVKNGKLLWSFPIESNAQIVTPIIYNDLVIFSAYRSPTNAIKINHIGNEYQVEKAWENTTISLYTSTPVLVENILYGLSYSKRGQFFGLDVQTGKTLWTSEGRIALGAAILDIGNVLVTLTSDSQLRILAKNTDSYKIIKQYAVSENPTWAHPVLLGKNILIKDEAKLTLFSLD